MINESLLSEIEFFKDTFKLLNNDLRKYEYRLKNHPFDPSEKKLLQAFLHFKKNNKEIVLGLLQGYTLQNSFYEGVRLYLLGLAQNHFCSYAFAVENLKMAMKLFNQLDETDFYVYSITSLVLALGNQRNIPEMENYVDLMQSFTSKSDHAKMLMIHAELVYLVMAEKKIQARNLLDKTLKGKNKSLELFRPAMLILLFSIRFSFKDYTGCYEALESYKKAKGFTVQLNYKYMKSLLDHLVERKTLYIYENDYRDFPELFHHLEVIKAFSVRDVPRAQSFWTLLQKHNPTLYLPNFEYNGGPSLFQSALELYSDHAVKEKVDLSGRDFRSVTEKLDFIFSELKGSISKDDLIKILWNDEPSEASQNRLRQLVYTYNKKYPLKIVSYQNTYKVDKKAS